MGMEQLSSPFSTRISRSYRQWSSLLQRGQTQRPQVSSRASTEPAHGQAEWTHHSRATTGIRLEGSAEPSPTPGAYKLALRVQLETEQVCARDQQRRSQLSCN